MIPFNVPAKFAAEYAAGSIVRFGTLLKDANTGRIVGHLQETGLLQKTVQSLGGFDPTGVSGVVGTLQNSIILNKINNLQSGLSFLQGLQSASLATSVIGVGVTAASTAIILNRLSQIDNSILNLKDEIRSLGDVAIEREVRNLLADLQTELERLEEIPYAKWPEARAQSSEEKLHRLFNKVLELTVFLSRSSQNRFDAKLFSVLISALALSASAGLKLLMWLDDIEIAKQRTKRQLHKVDLLQREIPTDRLSFILAAKDPLSLKGLSEQIREIRHRFASLPFLLQALENGKIGSRDYLQEIENNENAELLVYRL